MNNNFRQRFGETIIGLGLLFFGLSALGSNFGLALGMLIIGGLILSRQYRASNPNRGQSTRRSSDYTRERFFDEVTRDIDEYRKIGSHSDPLQRHDGIYDHALTAARAAGIDPKTMRVLPADIGMMVLSGDTEPVIHRSAPIGDDVDYIQPFVQIQVPQKAYGRVKFEILDSDGQVLFIHEDFHNLQAGMNLITPAARLPIHDAHATRGKWTLRVHADSMLIAEHKFGWEESPENVLRRQLGEDGEISNELRAMLSDNRLERLSLDELLGEQESEESKTLNAQRQEHERQRQRSAR
jgi:hypothetical protein